MRIFEFNDYRDFLKKHIHSLPKQGRGEISKMAEALQVAQPLMSQITTGVKGLNLEQADLLSEYLHFTEKEKAYLFVLVQIERAGRQTLKKHFITERERLKKDALDVRTVIAADKKLTDVEKSIFYSSWLYQAVRLLTSMEKNEYSSVEQISTKLGYDRTKVTEIMTFLLQTGLCVQEKNHIVMGPLSTHLEHTSPQVARHHTNWRHKAIQKFDQISEDELVFTAPMTVSRADFQKIREEILQLIKSMYSTVKASPGEELACLNIDFFKV